MIPRRALLAMLTLLACRRGPVLRARAAATRVVSLAPSATETLFAIGAGDRVVGVSSYDDFPPEATQRPRVGGIVDPNFEVIVSLRPDAVVGVQGPIDRGLLDRLGAMGVRLEFPRIESITEVLAAIDRLGTLVGRAPEATALRDRLRRELDAVAARVRGRPRPRVVAVLSVAPLVVAGAGSWVDELITLTGGTNVIATGVRYPTVSVEVLLRSAPAVVLDFSWHAGGGDLRALVTAHGATNALSRSRFVTLNDSLFVRPGPRVGEAARRLAAVLHPVQ